MKVFQITLTFTTKAGVQVQRTVQLRDSFRANAEARAKLTAVPVGATNVAATGRVSR